VLGLSTTAKNNYIYIYFIYIYVYIYMLNVFHPLVRVAVIFAIVPTQYGSALHHKAKER